MESRISKSIGLLLAVSLGCELASCESQSSGGLSARLLDRCCQVGREGAVESAKFNCKLTAREALLSASGGGSRSTSQPLVLATESLLARDPNFADQCEMVLESCCLAHHRTRNCNSGKQFAKSGAACMDVELSKEATVATESFNDCCMSCSLGILAARNPAQNESSLRTPSSHAERCRLLAPLASSLSGQLYEQTYLECCQENLPRPSGALTLDSGAAIDCAQAPGVCSQRCLSAGSQDPVTRRPLERDRCDCFTGYKLAADGLSCLDLDECRLNLHTCNRHSEVCDNTRGSFRCLARNQQQQQQQQHSSHSHSHQQLQPQARSLALDELEPLGGGAGELPFASMRLCAPGSRWLSAESRCAPNSSGEAHQQQQQQWKRSAAFSASVSSSSRRSLRAAAAAAK